MVNTDVAKVIYATVADATHVYPVPFTPLNDMTTGNPALSVLLGGSALNYVADYTYSAEGVQLVATPEAGQQLIIAQGQPFTQNIDLSFGLIDPEQIEAGFDQSVVRDQQIRDATSAAQATADAAATAADSASNTANEAKTTADSASTTANAAKATAEAAQTKATAAENTANAALDAVSEKQDIIPDLETIRAGAAKGATAVQPAAISDMETKTHATATYQPKGDYVTTTELSAGLATKADTTTTDTLRNDVDGLGDQVHEIEAKVPADASASNQLATKADLANVDTLPAQEGNAGKFLTTDGTTASWAEVPQGGGGSSADNNGLEGDYCSKYGIVDETKSGLPTQGAGNQIIIPAQLVMDVPGVSGLTTNASKITHDLVSTTNCEIFLAEGTVIEATDVFFQTDEPEYGTTGYAAWWNGTEWKFKSNDTGNVWRATNAVRIAKCIFADGLLDSLCFAGCRVLDKQEWLPKNGFTQADPINYSIVLGTTTQYTYHIYMGAVAADFRLSVGGKRISFGYGKIGIINSQAKYAYSLRHFDDAEGFIGTKVRPWDGLYVKTINGGADNAEIAVPTTRGTMVVATPPTADGNYVLKATVSGGVVTTQWVVEA